MNPITLTLGIFLAFGGVLYLGSYLMARGITRYQFRIFTIVLALTLALSIAIILGLRIEGNVHLALEVDNWGMILGPVAVTAILLTLAMEHQ